MDDASVVRRVEDELRAVADPGRAEHERAYLKSDLAFLGASVPQIRSVARSMAQDRSDVTHDELVGLVVALWAEEIHELRMVAVELLELFVDRLSPGDARLLHGLLADARTWALVDGLAASVVGPLLEDHPAEMDPVVRRWANDEDFWVRRASLLAHLGGLRRGDGNFDRFGGLADAMLEETEFFIRKAIGWVLRETGKIRPDLVVAWLEPRIGRAAGLTVREAVKYLPPDDRERLLAARTRPSAGVGQREDHPDGGPVAEEREDTEDDDPGP